MFASYRNCLIGQRSNQARDIAVTYQNERPPTSLTSTPTCFTSPPTCLTSPPNRLSLPPTCLSSAIESAFKHNISNPNTNQLLMFERTSGYGGRISSPVFPLSSDPSTDTLPGRTNPVLGNPRQSLPNNNSSSRFLVNSKDENRWTGSQSYRSEQNNTSAVRVYNLPSKRSKPTPTSECPKNELSSQPPPVDCIRESSKSLTISPKKLFTFSVDSLLMKWIEHFRHLVTGYNL